MSPGLLALLVLSQTPNGELTVPLARWQALNKEIEQLERPVPPPVSFAYLRRDLTVRFDRGVLTGTLQLVVETYREGPVNLPLLDGQASLTEVRVDNARFVALRSMPHYTVQIAAPGRHVVEVDWVMGKEESRFSRAFRLGLPVAPTTRATLQLPERDLTVQVEGGVVLAQTPTDLGLKVEAALTAVNALEVQWSRRVTHQADRTREMEATGFALVTPGDEMIRSETELAFRMISGETDRLEVHLPEAVEVTEVFGPSILQWFVEGSKDTRRLVVLLKYLIDDAVSVTVKTQMPTDDPTSVPIILPTPANAPLRMAHMAVAGRTGYAVAVQTATGHKTGPREIPEKLLNRSRQPLLFAYRHERTWPAVSMSIAKNAQVDLTQTVIDDLQCSSVFLEQGLEITKMRLYVRNNTTQYLSMILPPGARVTHALIDGTPFQPATTVENDGESRLLVPLRQSEKLERRDAQIHVVQPGETLSEIAMRYYNHSNRWQSIQHANPDVMDAYDLYAGQRLRIPARTRDVRIEESNFVIELAYKVKRPRLKWFGRRVVQLPKIDIPVMSVTWHDYFPQAYTPLSISTNLEPRSHIRYDPIRRWRYFWESASWIRSAWAGSAQYANILKSRKAIYQLERKTQVVEALSDFPLVGERYRFFRVLLGQEQATIESWYADRRLLPWMRGLAGLLALIAGWAMAMDLLRRGLIAGLWHRSTAGWGAVGAAGFVVGLYVLGTHRSMLLGFDLGLLGGMLTHAFRHRDVHRTWLDPLRSISGWSKWLSVLRIAGILGLVLILWMVLSYPLLLTTAALVVLTFLLVRRAQREVHHA